ncbi:MAG: hypothetical protein IJ504_00740 [Bacteroidales bacterium]|nr:hypothetical protein [Bacteroidales bacterium]
MIVDSMTLTEVAKTIRQDLRTLSGRIENVARKFRSDILSKKNRMYPFMKFYDISSEQKIRYFVGMKAEKRSDWKNPSMMISGTYILKDGQYGFLMCPSQHFQATSETLLIMTPHFLTRYRERHHDNVGLTTDEMIRRFVRTNHMFYMTELDKDHSLAMEKYTKDGVNQLAVVTPEGYCIAEKETYDCIRLMTFLSHEMLSEKQKTRFQQDKDYGNNRLKILELAGLIDNEIKL